MGNVGTVEGIDGGDYAVEMEADRILRVAGPLLRHKEKEHPRWFSYGETYLRQYLDETPAHAIVRLEDFRAKQDSFREPIFH